MLLASGCRGVEYVPVPEVHELYQDRYIHDSIYRDRWHTEYVVGDTVYLIDSIVSNRYLRVTDSVIRIDTVPYLDTSAIASRDRVIDSLRQQLSCSDRRARQQRVIFIVLLILSLASVVAIYLKSCRK